MIWCWDIPGERVRDWVSRLVYSGFFQLGELYFEVFWVLMSTSSSWRGKWRLLDAARRMRVVAAKVAVEEWGFGLIIVRRA